jgi:hypothetical protein
MTNRFVSPEQQFINNAGQPYAAGQLFFYLSGTSTPTPTYSDQALTIPNSNPVILDAAGNAGNIFLNSAITYKVVLEDANNNPIWTFDPVIPTDAPSNTAISAAIISCTPTGGPNAITLTPINASQLPAAYANFVVFAFVPSVSTTGAVTLQVGSLAFFPLFTSFGVQANTGDLIANQGPYFVAYGSLVAGASPGFLLLNSGNTLGKNVAKSASYAVQSTDNGQTHTITGSTSITATVGAPGGFPSPFKLKWYNASSRGVLLNISGITAFYLYPTQTAVLESAGSAWEVSPLFQRYEPPVGSSLFVDPSGSDSNDGLTTGATGAFATPQHAFNILKGNIDVSSGTPTIQCANGTYNVGAGIILTYALTGGNQFSLTGNAGSPGSCILQCNAGGVCLFGRDGMGTVTVTGFDFHTTGNGSTGINCSQFYQIDFGSLQFDAFPVGTHIAIADLGSMDITGNYTISGSAPIHLSLNGQAKCNYGTFTVNLPNALAFTLFLSASALSWLNAGGVPITFTGAGAGAGSTGSKYSVTQNSVVNSSSTTFPGASAGTTGSGGIFA